METTLPGMVRLRVGDVLSVKGRKHIVDYVSPCSARVIPLEPEKRVINDRLNGVQKTIYRYGEPDRISLQAERAAILERRGEDAVKNMRKGASHRAHEQQTGATNESEDSSMAKKNKTAKAEKSAEVNGARSKGKLGELMGHSVVSVLRALGNAGVSTAHAREIMVAQGLKVSPTTVSIQVNNGRNKNGTPATLTGAQITELTKSAAEPVKEPKAEKAPKAKAGKAKATKAPKAKKAKASEPTAETAPATTEAAPAAA